MRSVSESDSQTVSSVIGRQHIPNMGHLMLLQRGGTWHIYLGILGRKSESTTYKKQGEVGNIQVGTAEA